MPREKQPCATSLPRLLQFYEPSAVIYHEVPKSQVQKAYFLDCWFDNARADIRAFGIPAHIRWHLGGIPLVFFRRLTVWTLRWMVAIEPSRRFSCKLNVWTVSGQILECYRQSRDTKGPVGRFRSANSKVAV